MAESNEPNPPHDPAADGGGHEHDHGPEAVGAPGHAHGDPFHVHPTRRLDTEGFDPAQRSLAEALRISFAILKAAVVILLLVFIGIGSYRKIEKGQVGVRVRFGAPQGQAVTEKRGAVQWLRQRFAMGEAAAQTLAGKLFFDGTVGETIGPVAVASGGRAWGVTSERVAARGDREAARWRLTMIDRRGPRRREQVVAARVRLPDDREAVQVSVRRFEVDVLQPGAHFAFPEPIERIIVVPTTVKSVTIGPVETERYDLTRGEEVAYRDTGFWFEQAPEEIGRPLREIERRAGGLVPGRDGSLLTRDEAIVHGLFTIDYRVDPAQAAAFVQQVGSAEIRRSLLRARHLVRQAASRAIVHTVAQTTVEQFWRGEVNRAAIADKAQRMLDEMESGLRITQVSVDRPTPPLSVLDSFNRVNQAQADRQRRIETARREATEMLTETAGRAYEPLAAMLEVYRDARRDRRGEMAALARRAVGRMLEGETVAEALWLFDEAGAEHPALQPGGVLGPAKRQQLAAAFGPETLSGDARQVIEEARSARQDIETRVRAQANTFNRYLERYGEFAADGGDGPRRLIAVNEPLRRIIVHRRWQEMLEHVVTNAGETFWLPSAPDHLYLELGRNPDLRRATEREARRENIEAAGDE